MYQMINCLSEPVIATLSMKYNRYAIVVPDEQNICVNGEVEDCIYLGDISVIYKGMIDVYIPTQIPWIILKMSNKMKLLM